MIAQAVQLVANPVGLIGAATARSASRWRLSAWGGLLPKIEREEQSLQTLEDAALHREGRSLRYQAKSGTPLKSLLPRVFALVREAARRELGMRHYDVQVLGGIAMFSGGVAEMQTGEGKTLTATLPAVLHALVGKGVHIATVNDYLARRDAQWMTPVYERLGLSVGRVETATSRSQRRREYACDITYGTAREFGFDFLKDRLARRAANESSASADAALVRTEGPGMVQRPAYFALVDEADSILIDDARTPLIISAAPASALDDDAAAFQWAANVAPQFGPQHVHTDPETKRIELNQSGMRVARSLLSRDHAADLTPLVAYEYVERAIQVRDFFHREQHYIVRDGEVVIVDESTGRLAEGRKWGHGIHQAIEAKEGVKVTVETGHCARITLQDFFRRYPHVGGMTGTAATSRREIQTVYEMPVVAIPTHRPRIREVWPPRVLATESAKWEAIVSEVIKVHQYGRPVLVGTRSIEKSEQLSVLLGNAGIDHEVLNARHVAQEAQIIARAGEGGRVTVATNMAGRGTDIRLGAGVEELGGLHVIGSEMHHSARVDRQLQGRCGRQGDPGSFRQYASLEDAVLIEAFGTKTTQTLPLSLRPFRTAQARLERKGRIARRVLLQQEHARQKMQKQMGRDPYLDLPD